METSQGVGVVKAVQAEAWFVGDQHWCIYLRQGMTMAGAMAGGNDRQE